MENIEISTSAAILILLLFFGVVGVGAVLNYVYRIQSAGTIKAVGIQIKDDNGNVITKIDWGILNPASITTRNIYAVNNGTAPITLILTTENWNPPQAENYITLSWNYPGTPITAGQSYPIILTLTVSEDITGISNFSFDIVVIAQEVE